MGVVKEVAVTAVMEEVERAMVMSAEGALLEAWVEGAELRVGAAARAEAVGYSAELVGEVHIALGNRANPFPNSTRWSLPPTPRRTSMHHIDHPGTPRC